MREGEEEREKGQPICGHVTMPNVFLEEEEE